MFPTFISILDIQSWWEVPSIAHFCSLFRTAFNLLDFDIEDLEEALLTDGTEEPSWLQDLIVLLLKGCLQEQDISPFNYQMFLRRLFRKKCEEYAILNPFNTDTDFELLPLRAKIEILYNLCEFRLDSPDVLEELKNLEADSLRIEPIGYDKKKSAYWYFYGTRLYREDYSKSEKPIWQVVCFSITDWSQLAKKFELSKCRAEQALYKTLKKNFIPELPRLFLEKETLARKRLLETKRVPKDESFVHWDEYDRGAPPAAVRQPQSIKLERKFESFDAHVESRYEMAKAKDKKHKSKDGVPDRSTTTSSTPAAKPKDAKPVGRQTNNSLASATGQILIQPVSNPNKKKMKTSQVFSQSDEDLQTGLHKILDHVKDHEDAWPFIEPVEEEYAPNYYSIIRKPMDLQKMEERLESGHYKSFSKFKLDFQLIVNNCRLYNGVENEYSEMVDNVLEAFNRAVERYLDQVSSSDDEIAVEFPEVEKHKKRKHSESTHKSKKKSGTPSRGERKRHDSESHETRDEKSSRKKQKDDLQDDRVEAKTKSKKDKEKEKDGDKRHKEEYEEKVTHKKGKKRKLEEQRSKSEERQIKIRKQDVKLKQKSKRDEKSLKIDKDKGKDKRDGKRRESKEPESKLKKKEKLHEKQHKLKKVESKKSNLSSNKKTKKSVKRINSRRSSSRSLSRSRSPSLDRFSDSPPPSSLEDFDLTPSKSMKDTEDFKDKKPKHDKHDNVKDVKDNKSDREDALIKPKDKHNTLRETIEKLKAKSDLAKLKVEKDLKIYDFPNEPRPAEKRDKDKEAINKKKEKALQKKKKDLFDEDSADVDNKSSKHKPHANNSKKFDALSLATEQTLKDINKWLDDTPKFPEFSSASNSPSQFSGIDDFDSATNKSSDIDKAKDKMPMPISKDKDKEKESTTPNANSNNNNNNNNANSSVNANNKKRPLNRDPTKIFRRKEVQRTIDRLQPGKSKGNLLTNVQSKDTKQEEIFPLGPLSKIKDTKNSLIVKTDDSAPKLSLGSVLDSFGKHKFIDDELKEAKKEEEEADKAEKPVVASQSDEKKSAEVRTDVANVDSPKLDNSPGTATPNLSAWFKAFGGPKVQSVAKKTDGLKDDKTVANTDSSAMEAKKEEQKKVLLPDPSPNPESPTVHGQPATRQRKVSTGSSMSERSSFSQDMDSPRVGIDERIGAYPAPYPSPMHKSESGASPSLRSPLPDASPKATPYPFNGQIRVGFYQDTVSTKSSPDKSCSPRDNPQSPYAHYSEHIYTPPTTQNSNYSYNPYYQQPGNYSINNPTSPYNSESHTPSYYDTTKPLTDQYNAKNPHSPSGQHPAQQASQQQQPAQPQHSPLMAQQHSPHMAQQHSPHMAQPQHSPLMAQQQHSPLMTQQPSPNVHHQASPVDIQQYQQPNSPVIPNQQQVNDGYRQSQSQSPLPQQQVQQQQPMPVPMYNNPQMQQQVDNANFRGTMDYGRQPAPPNVEPFRNAETTKLQSNNYPVKKRAYNEIEQTESRSYDESYNSITRHTTQQEQPPSRDPSKYIHQNIPEPRGISTQIQQPLQQTQQSNPAVNQFPPSNFNYPPEGEHQYPPINIPSANRTSMNPPNQQTLEESRKVDLSKYTNMGYTGPDINLPLHRNQHFKQPSTATNTLEPLQQQPQRFVNNSGLNINNYKGPTGHAASNSSLPGSEAGNNYKAEVTIPRPPYGSSSQMEMDQSLSIRGLSHIVDRFPNEDSRMLGLQGNPPPSYYSDKNLPPQHLFAGKSIATSASSLPIFSQPNTYGVQHPNAPLYNRQMTDLQVPVQNPPQQQQVPLPTPPAPAPEPKPKKKRVTKAAKAAAAAAAAAQAAQASANQSQPPEQPPPTNQGFQSYAGLKNASSGVGEPSAISLKTASVVPGSAFNFGPNTTGLSLPPGIYGDKECYSNFLDDIRSAPNYYMAAAAAAHHRPTPENAEKTQATRASVAHQSNNPSGVPSTAGYSFIGAPQGRPPSYPLGGVPGPFMPPHQAPLMDTSSPQYLQYLQAGVLHQGLLPPSAYAPGYHPALSMRQPFDPITRPPWL